MKPENPQKIKLLVLLEYLRENTDEDHPLITQEICAHLEEIGISCDRRTLYKDIDLLNSYGYEIMSVNIGHNKGYYIADRDFSVPELKILIDALEAASFVPEKKTRDLVAKLSKLAGRHQAELLSNSLVCYNTRKHTNDTIYYTVDFLERAIREHKQVSFLYFDLDENGAKVYRKEKNRYVADPMALIYNEDNYYLITYNQKYDARTNYRVDRMEHVEIEDEPVSEKAIFENQGLSNFTEQVFKMYAGEKCDVKLLFDRSLINVIFDKFGEDTKIIHDEGNWFRANVTVQISPTFYGWVFQFAERMKILSPLGVHQEYLARCQAILNTQGGV